MSIFQLVTTGLFLFCIDVNATKYRQEGAVFKVVNPKYFANATIFTGRQRRGDTYKTNITGVLLQPANNNVTVQISYKVKGSDDVGIDVKACDVYKWKWITEFIKTYSDVGDKCPIPANTYHFTNVELPLKFFPLPLPKGGAVSLTVTLFVTATREKMMEVMSLVHVT